LVSMAGKMRALGAAAERKIEGDNVDLEKKKRQ
jgi:hypothetical protein